MFVNIVTSVKKLIAFVKSVLSERDGTGSASRTIGIMVAGGGILSLLIYVFLKRDLPNGDVLGGLAKVIGVGSFGYSANQIRAAFGQGEDKSTPPADSQNSK